MHRELDFFSGTQSFGHRRPGGKSCRGDLRPQAETEELLWAWTRVGGLAWHRGSGLASGVCDMGRVSGLTSGVWTDIGCLDWGSDACDTVGGYPDSRGLP